MLRIISSLIKMNKVILIQCMMRLIFNNNLSLYLKGSEYLGCKP